jgi:hypothetical protein
MEYCLYSVRFCTRSIWNHTIIELKTVQNMQFNLKARHQAKSQILYIFNLKAHKIQINKINLRICVVPTQPFRVAPGTDSRVCYPGSRQANSMSTHVLLPLAVNSKSEQKVNSLPPLGFEPVLFRMLAHLSDHSAKSHQLTLSPPAVKTQWLSQCQAFQRLVRSSHTLANWTFDHWIDFQSV